MAVSPSHKLGQMIGEEFESAVKTLLLEVTQESSFYLDFQHPRDSDENPCREEQSCW